MMNPKNMKISGNLTGHLACAWVLMELFDHGLFDKENPAKEDADVKKTMAREIVDHLSHEITRRISFRSAAIELPPSRIPYTLKKSINGHLGRYSGTNQQFFECLWYSHRWPNVISRLNRCKTIIEEKYLTGDDDAD